MRNLVALADLGGLENLVRHTNHGLRLGNMARRPQEPKGPLFIRGGEGQTCRSDVGNET